GWSTRLVQQVAQMQHPARLVRQTQSRIAGDAEQVVPAMLFHQLDECWAGQAAVGDHDWAHLWWQQPRSLVEQLIDLGPIRAVQLARPAAPRQRQRSSA